MSALDWIVLATTLVGIVAYGLLRTRGIETADAYLRGGGDARWHTIGLSIMATQASAITFLSTPGQAWEDGMRFVQFYFGLPIAMVLLSAFVLPVYYRLRVITAYEYLEQRFDRRTRQLAALLFLVQRGLAAGITIYAPAIILSTLLGWSLNGTCMVIGGLVILYTVSGGTRAVSQTQKQQMIVMMSGMVAALVYIVAALPDGVSLSGALSVAGALDHLNVVDFSFDPDTRYTFWSGITGGLFLAMSYFGTDQSQVQRYLTGQTLAQSRLGLLMNGMLKVPMQFLILFIGVMVFVFYVFEPSPAFFNRPARDVVAVSANAGQLAAAEAAFDARAAERRDAAHRFVEAVDAGDEAAEASARDELRSAHAAVLEARRVVKLVVATADPDLETNDTDYVFLTFVMSFLPAGLIGLVIAVVLSAAMSSTASELNALGTTTIVDFYRRSWVPHASDRHYLLASKAFTVVWGALAVAFATYASLLENLIEAVNIIGSLFYGTILGIFGVGLFLPRIGAVAVFRAALFSQAVVTVAFFTTDIGFLWFNAIGCGLVVGVGSLLAQRER